MGKSWWSGDKRVESYMSEIKEELNRQGIEGQQKIQIYNRAYEAVYKAICDCTIIEDKIKKAFNNMK